MKLGPLPIAFAAIAGCAFASGPPATPARTILAPGVPGLGEEWPPARTLVWARPGVSGLAREPENWTEYGSAGEYAAGGNGKPAELGPDNSCDLILPGAPAGETYVVGCMVTPKERQRQQADSPSVFLSCRHLDIGAGASLDGGMGVSRGKVIYSDMPAWDTPIGIRGNVTVRDGACIYGHLQFLGDQHTWFRMGTSPEPLGRSLLIRKAPGASVTMMAPRYDLVDAVSIESGRLVLAPGTGLRINATPQARIDLQKLRKRGFGRVEPYVHVHDEGTLEMQAGSRIGRVEPPGDICADLRIEGLLEVGGGGTDPVAIELTMAEGDGTFLNQPGGLYFCPGSRVRNHGTLLISAGHSEKATRSNGVSVFLEEPVDLGRVKIDHLRAGGIAVTGPATAKSALANATFGEHCAVGGEAVLSAIELDAFMGGPGKVEFIDGLSTECEILFPLGDRLIVRSHGNRIAQSFDLRSVHAIAVRGGRVQFNPLRPLNPAEEKLRQRNALWADVPGEGQIGRYGSFEWPGAPLMVWRHPGRSGSRFVGANWLDETGRPFFDPPLGTSSEGPDTPAVDILLPAADDFYQAVGDRPSWRCRHLTIESNAHFFLTYNIGGNLWMKDGSGMQAPWFGMYSNEQPGVHRFLRFDGMRLGRPGRSGVPPRVDSAEQTISQWGRYQTGPGGTLEIIGTHMVNDHFFIGGEGRTIMSEGSHLAPLAARAAFWIQPGGTVVMLQDARIGVESSATDRACIPVLVSGTLEIGTPERPITRDMDFPLAGMEVDKINRQPGENMRGSGVSLLVGKEGRLRIHSIDPGKARVVFRMHDSERARTRGKRWGDPEGIVLSFAGEAELDGVVFDKVLAEGIMATPALRAGWKNIFYGEHNLAAPEDLYWKPRAGE